MPIFCKMAAIEDLAIRIFCISMIYGTCFGLNCFENTNIDTTGPVVQTSVGTIVGKYIQVLNKKAAVFLGIPYAKPPVREKRFQISEPIEAWNNILLATEKSPACMQYSTREVGWIPPPTLNFSEDCLYLNVWLPPNCCCTNMDKLPVMVWIHGGGFYSGSAMMDLYDGDILAALGNVVVVTLNYRLSAFGFLNLNSKEAPGNQGLYDQHLALKWTKENIAYFGGDSNSVTLFGNSAGSLSVSLQKVSPLSHGLFHKSIMESGSVGQPFKVVNVSGAINKAIKFAKVAGCSIDNSTSETTKNDILNCLRDKTAEELAETDNYFTSKTPHFFTASYGNDCDDCLKYFNENPVMSTLLGSILQVPSLVGVNKDEGTIFMIYTIPRIFRRDQTPLLTIPVAKQLHQDFINGLQETDIPADKVFNYYLENITGNSSDPALFTLKRSYSDYEMKCGNMFFADNLNKAYFYYFSHHSKKDTNADWIGVPHFYEVPYVFGEPIRNPENYTVEDVQFSEDIIHKWTSFAHHGYPITKDSEPKWPPYSPSDPKVYELKAGGNKVILYPSAKACNEIWSHYFFH